MCSVTCCSALQLSSASSGCQDPAFPITAVICGPPWTPREACRLPCPGPFGCHTLGHFQSFNSPVLTLMNVVPALAVGAKHSSEDSLSIQPEQMLHLFPFQTACSKVALYRLVWVFPSYTRGLPWWFSGKESTCQCRRCFSSRIGKIP